MSKLKSSEAKLLLKWDTALDNAVNQKDIAKEMGELGFDVEKINEGRVLFKSTEAAYNSNKKEDDESSAASKIYKAKKLQLETTFKKHRKRALVALEDDSEAIDRLEISGAYPSTTARLFDTVDKFYAETTTDSEIQGKLAQYKVTPEALTTTKDSIVDVKKARTAYKKEQGESENATKIKDAAFAKMELWMRKFYKVANIAMEDYPQLLEALEKKVKS